VGRPPNPLPDRLVFSYQEDEARAYSRLVWARRDRGPGYDNFWAAMIVITFAIGFSVLFANYLGWVTSSQMRPVLFTAYAAFVAGALAYHAAMRIRYRAVARAMYRDSAMGTETFEMTFDGNGVVYRNAKFELHVPWAAVAEVIETSLIVVLLFRSSQGLPIPARLFSGAGSRASFAAVMREHASAARQQP
jgi:hypothetical protein